MANALASIVTYFVQFKIILYVGAIICVLSAVISLRKIANEIEYANKLKEEELDGIEN